MTDELWQKSACDLAEGVARRQFSCAEVMASVAGRIRAKNKALNDSFNGGMEAVKSKQWDVAVQSFTKASELDPKQHIVWAQLADSYIQLAGTKTGDEQTQATTKGLEAYGKALELKPDDAAYHNNYALALARAKKFDEAQAELARVNRMNAMGALAASISHEVNQPLAAVVTNADACMMWLTADPPNLEEVRAAVDCIAREGTRASEVVRHIRSMFTKGAPERVPVKLNQLIREVAALMEAQASRNQVPIEIEIAGGHRLRADASVDAALLRSVIEALVGQ